MSHYRPLIILWPWASPDFNSLLVLHCVTCPCTCLYAQIWALSGLTPLCINYCFSILFLFLLTDYQFHSSNNTKKSSHLPFSLTSCLCTTCLLRHYVSDPPDLLDLDLNHTIFLGLSAPGYPRPCTTLTLQSPCDAHLYSLINLYNWCLNPIWCNLSLCYVFTCLVAPSWPWPPFPSLTHMHLL